ncbi:ring-opening amidohydrolase [Rhizobium johnstonii]|uniref:cyanuric acid amidohydrolase n=1 Tax=Rhizobium TaxID=379 RepID=UPI0010323407|nr:ring-opening amidohydrolase [Rhizobium leguminosarum]TBF70828.1 ring-opening amidohydrolase [Rhizobium leguminosarum]TBG93303.1 ring-opening amidohydrolase [Rhizobium leguminosarum]TBG98705.1 ring-opening amidohydrolase [Rhizobium leguminosarum]TBH29918.1 ring-opening amidohydrolase [Rhizobium leguminosarum]TBH50148.1 ring-opening amidohydrolase [Rhizobium leguminosarum]
MQAGVYRFSLPDPGDVSALAAAITGGCIDPHSIVAVIGKTHGNGLVNDYTRGYLAQSLAFLIAEKTGLSPDIVRQRVPFIFSGGVEGVLSPHYTVFTASRIETTGSAKGLAIGVTFTPDLEPEDIGRQRQIDLTSAAVHRAMSSAMISDVDDVHFVQVKGPAFTQADIVASLAKGETVAIDNPGKLMAFGRAASALGVGKALGEIPEQKAVADAVLRDFNLFSSVASISAGVEVRCNEVVVIGLSKAWGGDLTISHAQMADALDLSAVHPMLRRLGFSDGYQLGASENERIKACFVKCEAARSGAIRGRPHTMLNDGDMDQQRHIRGAVGAIVASILGDTALFVSGGAEHQGPDGGGLVSLIVKQSGAA